MVQWIDLWSFVMNEKVFNDLESVKMWKDANVKVKICYAQGLVMHRVWFCIKPVPMKPECILAGNSSQSCGLLVFLLSCCSAVTPASFAIRAFSFPASSPLSSPSSLHSTYSLRTRLPPHCFSFMICLFLLLMFMRHWLEIFRFRRCLKRTSWHCWASSGIPRIPWTQSTQPRSHTTQHWHLCSGHNGPRHPATPHPSLQH